MKQFINPSPKRDISSEWLQALVEYALDGIVIMDDKGRILDLNPAAEKIFGYSSKDIIGHMVSEKLIPSSKIKTQRSDFPDFFATGKENVIGERVEITAMRADKTEFPAELDIISINPESTPVFIAYIRDISKQKQAELDRIQYAMNIKNTLLQTIMAISRTVEMRDPYTAGHQRHVAHLAAAMGKEVKLSEARIEGLYLGGLIHDIGKIAIPAAILARPGKLHPEDINYLKVHCQKGYEILEPVEFPWPLAEIALQHHEHLDGSGYPQGLKGDKILLEARIVCVADIVESLTAHRPYRPAYPLKEALAFISKNAGKQYDQSVVDACVRLFKNGYHIDAIDMGELNGLPR